MVNGKKNRATMAVIGIGSMSGLLARVHLSQIYSLLLKHAFQSCFSAVIVVQHPCHYTYSLNQSCLEEAN